MVNKRFIQRVYPLIFTPILFISSWSFAQNDTANYPYWIEMMNDPDANYFQTVRAFDIYWENREITPGCGYKPFKRWQHSKMNAIDAQGNLKIPSHTYEAMKNWSMPKSLNGNWLQIGPNYNQTTVLGDIPGVGRLNTIAFHPSDTNIIYVGAPAGGLWKTENYGASWEVLTDDLPTLGVSAIVIDPMDPNIIYIGTGDRDADDAPGLGVFKSIDGGQTFDQKIQGMNEVVVNEMRIHPDSNEVIYAGTSKGLFKTWDSGENWTKIVTASTNFEDIEIKPGDASTVFCVRGSRLYRSQDYGVTWEPNYDVPVKTRMFIDVTPADPNVVYAIVSNLRTFHSFWKSTDGGDTFVEMSATSPNILGYSADGSDVDGGQAWYDLTMEADPLDANKVYVGGIRVFRTDDGGVTWNDQTSGSHVDMHYLKFSPHTKKLYLANDGGFYRLNNQGTWDDITTNMVIGMIYKIGQSQNDPGLVIAGFQDNGTSVFDGSSWGRVLGGDGMECIIDPLDDNYKYASLYYGNIYRSTGGGFPKIAGLDKNGIDEEGAWVTPFCIAEHNNGTMYAGFQNVWRTTKLKEGDNDDVIWENISQSLGNMAYDCHVIEHSPADSNLLFVSKYGALYRSNNCNDDSTSVAWTLATPIVSGGGNVNDVECHPYDDSVLYAATGNRIAMSYDQGENWIDISGSLPDIQMNCIVLDVSADEALYVGTVAGVYYRDTTMSDWVSFSNGLPMSVDVRELEIYHGNPKRMRAATYGRGVWESDLRSPDQINYPATALIASSAADMKREVYGTFNAEISFYKNLNNVDVSGLDISELHVDNGVVTSLVGGPQVYVATIQPTVPGLVSINVGDSVVLDMDSLYNLRADEYQIVYVQDPVRVGPYGPGGVGDSVDIAMWLDAAGDLRNSHTGEIALNDGDLVSRWFDQSVHGVFVDQMDSTRLPVFRTPENGINGLPAVEFAYDTTLEIGDWFEATVVPGREFSAYAVVESSTKAWSTHGWIASSREDNGFIFHVNNNATSYYANVASGSNNGFNSQTLSVDSCNIPTLVSFNYAENDLLRCTNNSVGIADAFRTGNSSTARSQTDDILLQLGRDRQDRHGDGKVGEYCIFNTRLGTSHYTIVKNYFATKYQIEMGERDRYKFDDYYRYDLAGIGSEGDYDKHVWAKGIGPVMIGNPSNLDSAEYLLWAHDGSSMNWVEGDLPLELSRLERTWRFDETGDVGQFYFSIQESSLPASGKGYALVTSNVADFSTVNNAYNLWDNGMYREAMIDVVGDVYFTIVEADAQDVLILEDAFEDNLLSVLGSPSNGNFSLVIQSEEAVSGVLSIYNSIGQIVFEVEVSEQTDYRQEFSEFANGHFIVNFNTGSTSESKPIIVAY